MQFLFPYTRYILKSVYIHLWVAHPVGEILIEIENQSVILGKQKHNELFFEKRLT